jgi:hypothetical protein
MAHVYPGAAVAAHWVLTGGGRDAMVSVVSLPFRAIAEGLVGSRNIGEAFGGAWIGAIAVWVVF